MQVSRIGLCEEQSQSLLRMRELYLHNLGALMRRRKELSALLRVCTSRPRTDAANFAGLRLQRLMTHVAALLYNGSLLTD